MISLHNLIIIIAGLQGFQSGTNHFKFSVNPFYNVFQTVNILIEIMLCMLAAYKFPALIVTVTIARDPIVNYLIWRPLKKLITNLNP